MTSEFERSVNAHLEQAKRTREAADAGQVARVAKDQETLVDFVKYMKQKNVPSTRIVYEHLKKTDTPGGALRRAVELREYFYSMPSFWVLRIDQTGGGGYYQKNSIAVSEDAVLCNVTHGEKLPRRGTRAPNGVNLTNKLIFGVYERQIKALEKSGRLNVARPIPMERAAWHIEQLPEYAARLSNGEGPKVNIATEY